MMMAAKGLVYSTVTERDEAVPESPVDMFVSHAISKFQRSYLESVKRSLVVTYSQLQRRRSFRRPRLRCDRLARLYLLEPPYGHPF